jgi:hypothetical protein
MKARSVAPGERPVAAGGIRRPQDCAARWRWRPKAPLATHACVALAAVWLARHAARAAHSSTQRPGRLHDLRPRLHESRAQIASVCVPVAVRAAWHRSLPVTAVAQSGQW